MRDLGSWLDGYGDDHRDRRNQILHWICVPLIVWCVIALLWTVPVPESFLRPGSWAVLAIVLSFYWYWKHAHRLALALLGAFALMAIISAILFAALGGHMLRWIALGVFVVAWVGQFIGHRFEGRRPSFFTDLAYLLIGPAWLMEKLMRSAGLKASA